MARALGIHVMVNACRDINSSLQGHSASTGSCVLHIKSAQKPCKNHYYRHLPTTLVYNLPWHYCVPAGSPIAPPSQKCSSGNLQAPNEDKNNVDSRGSGRAKRQLTDVVHTHSSRAKAVARRGERRLVILAACLKSRAYGEWRTQSELDMGANTPKRPRLSTVTETSRAGTGNPLGFLSSLCTSGKVLASTRPGQNLKTQRTGSAKPSRVNFSLSPRVIRLGERPAALHAGQDHCREGWNDESQWSALGSAEYGVESTIETREGF